MDLRCLEPWLFRIPVGAVSRLRILLYRILGMKIGRNNRIESIRVRRCSQIVIGNQCAITRGCMLFPHDKDSDQPRIVIGDHVFLNRSVFIDAGGLIEIASHSMIGPDTYIGDSNHSLAPKPDRDSSPMSIGHIKIGQGCWVGAKAVILKDVELGEFCIVAAGAVVTKSFPPRSVVAGVPARLIRTLPEERADS
jgi:acetyltransferase-like isoleucine patch superfamily enzyme